MRDLLLRLLIDLERIGEIHEELYDSEVRERMGEAVMEGFVRRQTGFSLARDFGMFSAEANAAVREAIQTYIAAANRLAEQLAIAGFHERLAAFQDSSVRTSSTRWNDYDEFFGHTPPQCYDTDGNVISLEGR